MRAPLFSVGAAARAAGFVAVTAIGIAAMLQAMRPEQASTAKDASGANAADAIAAELMRCQNIGLAAEDDRSCLAAWADSRRRFFGDEPPVIARAHPKNITTMQQSKR